MGTRHGKAGDSGLEVVFMHAPGDEPVVQTWTKGLRDFGIEVQPAQWEGGFGPSFLDWIDGQMEKTPFGVLVLSAGAAKAWRPQNAGNPEEVERAVAQEVRRHVGSETFDHLAHHHEGHGGPAEAHVVGELLNEKGILAVLLDPEVETGGLLAHARTVRDEDPHALVRGLSGLVGDQGLRQGDEDFLDTSVRLAEALSSAAPESFEAQHGLATAYNNKAALLHVTDRTKEGLEWADEALEVSRRCLKLAADAEQTQVANRAVVTVAANRAEMLDGLGRLQDALDGFGEALRVLEEMGPSPDVLEERSVIHQLRAGILERLGENTEASAEWRAAADVLGTFGGDDESGAALLAKMHQARAVRFAEEGRYEEAVSALATAGRALESLADEPSFAEAYVSILEFKAALWMQMKRLEEAGIEYRRIRDVLEHLAQGASGLDRPFEDGDLRERLAGVIGLQGSIEVGLGRVETAKEKYHDALAMLEAGPEPTAYRAIRGDLEAALADLLMAQGDSSQAVERMEAALRLLEVEAQEDAALRPRFGDLLIYGAFLCSKSDRVGLALGFADQAVDLFEDLAKSDAAYMDNLAAAYDMKGAVFRLAGRTSEAVEMFQRAERLRGGRVTE